MPGLEYYPNLLSPDTLKSGVYLDHLKKVISAASRLEIPVVNTFIGRDHTLSIDENFILSRKVWPDIVKTAEGKGVNIGIENCPRLWQVAANRIGRINRRIECRKLK